ncbi:hypothetical protein ATG70_3712 [Bacillus sp. es.036]|nr:hypothetical protein ATG70_3712 [Bacillus sp. es.036]
MSSLIKISTYLFQISISNHQIDPPLELVLKSSTKGLQIVVWITIFDTFHLFTSVIDSFYTKSSAVDSLNPQDMSSVDNHLKNIANKLFFCYDICVLTRE